MDEKQFTLFGKSKEELAEDLNKKEEEKDFPIDYIITQAKKDNYIYDIRCWPNGITKEEFIRKWDNNFEGDSPDKNFWGYGVNSGHFCMLIPIFKRLGGTLDQMWELMENTKDTALTELMQSEESSMEWNIKRARDYVNKYVDVPNWVKEPEKKFVKDEKTGKKKLVVASTEKRINEWKEEKIQDFAGAIQYANNDFESINAYRKELGKEPLPKPESLTNSFEKVLEEVKLNMIKELKEKIGEFDG